MSERPTELISDVSAVHTAYWPTEQPAVDTAQQRAYDNAYWSTIDHTIQPTIATTQQSTEL